MCVCVYICACPCIPTNPKTIECERNHPFHNPTHAIHNPSEEGALNAAGVAILAWLKDLNFGAVFALSLFPYLIFLRNIWPKDYPIPTVRACGQLFKCVCGGLCTCV